MNQLRGYAVIGDSNVKRHMTPVAIQGRPAMATAKIIVCGRLSTLTTSLSSVPSESEACIIACLSNFLTASKSSSVGSVALRVGPVLSSFVEKVLTFAADRPGTQVFVCPPMYRTNPLWYRDGLSEIMVLFKNSFKSVKPTNMWLMPSFSSPELEADGVHLSPFSGIKYVMHLFDISQELFSNSHLDDTQKISGLVETSRGLEDRVSIIEQDHARLSRSFELQSAITAEFMDYQENVRNEDFIMVQGLARLPKVDQKEWQRRAREAVDQVLVLMGFQYQTRYVQNLTARGSGSRTLYKARLESVAISREVRDKFSGYFAGGNDSRPASLSGISVRNCVTPGTLARIAILQLLGKRYKESNPGSRTQVVAYESRPILKLTPPESANSRIMVLNYIEAISKLPVNFSQDEIDGLLKRVSPRLFSSLRSTLVVLSEDMLKKKVIPPKKSKSKPTGPSTATARSSQDESDSSEFRTPEAVAGRKRGHSGSASAGPASKK